MDRTALLCDDLGMDLEELARKAVSKPHPFSAKRVAFFAAAGLFIVGGIALRFGQFFAEPAVEQKAAVEAPAPPSVAAPPVVAPEAIPKTPAPVQEAAPAPTEPPAQAEDAAEPAGPAGEAVEQAGETDGTVAPAAQPEAETSGPILVSRLPVAILASPSATAATMYGFPAGRPFRVIGREGGFAHIRDLKTGASGWIDETALAAPPAVAAPPNVPTASGSSPRNPVAVSQKPAKKNGQPTFDALEPAEPEPVEERPRLFGRGGILGGIFGGN